MFKTKNQAFPIRAVEFTFAGFNWPRHVANLPKGTLQERLARQIKLRAEGHCVGPYYHAPKPILDGKMPIHRGFYFNDQGMPGLRWKWADEVDPDTIHHTGWFVDEDGTGDKIRGVVFTLPKSRGFMCGWSMGRNMAAGVEYDVIEHKETAAAAADIFAESVAEEQRGYETEFDEDGPPYPADTGPSPEQVIEELREAIHILEEDRDRASKLCSQFEDAMGDLQIQNGKLQDANRELRRENEALKYDVKEYRRQLSFN